MSYLSTVRALEEAGMAAAARAPRQTRRAAVMAEFSPALISALSSLDKIISEGAEFPDACYLVAKRTGFLVSELRAAYDALDAA